MLDGISGVMDLAAASGEDLAIRSDIVTDALTAFGLTAADHQRLPSAAEEFPYEMLRRCHKDKRRDQDAANDRGSLRMLQGHHRRKGKAQAGGHDRRPYRISLPERGRDAPGSHALAAPVQAHGEPLQRDLPGAAAQHHSSRMPAYLLQQHSQIRHGSQDSAVPDGPQRHEREDKRLYPLDSVGDGFGAKNNTEDTAFEDLLFEDLVLSLQKINGRYASIVILGYAGFKSGEIIQLLKLKKSQGYTEIAAAKKWTKDYLFEA